MASYRSKNNPPTNQHGTWQGVPLTGEWSKPGPPCQVPCELVGGWLYPLKLRSLSLVPQSFSLASPGSLRKCYRKNATGQVPGPVKTLLKPQPRRMGSNPNKLYVNFRAGYDSRRPRSDILRNALVAAGRDGSWLGQKKGTAHSHVCM